MSETSLQNAYNRIEELELKLVSANERIKRLEVWGDVLDWLVPEPPDRNCSCHISPPCSDCVNWSDAREAKESWAKAKEAKL